jgi:epoxyqueuosine reductase
MTYKDIVSKFKINFDIVGIIHRDTYIKEAKNRNMNFYDIPYETVVVLGLAYPFRKLNHTKTHLVPSFYTFGSDYHIVLRNRVEDVMKDINLKYEFKVDNHPYDERLAATIAGLGYLGKNQLMINKDLGTYFFLGLVFLDLRIEKEVILEIDDSCGTCTKCIDACPVSALSENAFDRSKCMSEFNQSKRILTDDEIDKNYLLFGCDICQIVCPKNIGKGTIIHEEFQLSGKELVSIDDLFNLSEQAFRNKYSDMSYLWKGKTVLLRNALMLLNKTKNTDFIDSITKSIVEKDLVWYLDTANKVLNKIKKL